MPIVVTCSGCGKRIKASEKFAGREVACPNCKAPLLIPAAEDDAASFLLGDGEPDAPSGPAPASPRRERPADASSSPRPRPVPLKSAKADLASLPPLRMEETPPWLRHLHWLLALALIPLAVSLLVGVEERDLKRRFEETLKQATPEVQKRFGVLPDEPVVDSRDVQTKKGSRNKQPAKADDVSALTDDQILAMFPDQRLVGAFLPRNTWMHWVFALGAAVLFLAFLLFLAVDGAAEMGSMLGVALFTATIGIIFLFVVQWLAEWSQGYVVAGRSILVIIFWVVKLIGFSYRAAMEADNGFFLSFLGFTLGVGLCEEACKALPLLVRYRQPNEQSWRGAFLWGLASGTGFGIAEGIIYSRDMYNGIMGPGIYLVRFISCVALHALWTGSVGITLHQRQDLIQQELSWYDYIPRVVLIVGIPTVLHGLYDTLLKKELNAGALVVAIVSFLFLAYQISQLRGVDDEAARAKMLEEYKRRRAAMS